MSAPAKDDTNFCNWANEDKYAGETIVSNAFVLQMD